MRPVHCVAAASLLLTCLTPTVDGQQSQVNVSSLTWGSSAIVVGQLTSSGSSISLSVDRTIRGNIAPGAKLTIQRGRSLDLPCLEPAHDGSAYAVWFLDPSDNNRYFLANVLRAQSCNPLPAEFEIPPGAKPNRWKYPMTASPGDMLAFELGWSISEDRGFGPWIFVNFPDLLDGSSPHAQREIYRNLLASHGIHARIAGLLGLLKMGDPAAISYLLKNMDRIASTPLRAYGVLAGNRVALKYANTGCGPPTYEALIAKSIGLIQDPSERAMQSLREIAGLPTAPPEVRKAAATVLARSERAH